MFGSKKFKKWMSCKKRQNRPHSNLSKILAKRKIPATVHEYTGIGAGNTGYSTVYTKNTGAPGTERMNQYWPNTTKNVPVLQALAIPARNKT
jgi:hypothetical protein